MSLDPEILIYVQSVKEFFKKNENASKYFLENSDEELFFEHLTEISVKNYSDTGDPMLNQEQFELLRKTIIAITLTKKPEEEFVEEIELIDTPNNLFIEIPNFGMICLN